MENTFYFVQVEEHFLIAQTRLGEGLEENIMRLPAYASKECYTLLLNYTGRTGFSPVPHLHYLFITLHPKENDLPAYICQRIIEISSILHNMDDELTIKEIWPTTKHPCPVSRNWTLPSENDFAKLHLTESMIAQSEIDLFVPSATSCTIHSNLEMPEISERINSTDIEIQELKKVPRKLFLPFIEKYPESNNLYPKLAAEHVLFQGNGEGNKETTEHLLSDISMELHFKFPEENGSSKQEQVRKIDEKWQGSLENRDSQNFKVAARLKTHVKHTKELIAMLDYRRGLSTGFLHKYQSVFGTKIKECDPEMTRLHLNTKQ